MSEAPQSAVVWIEVPVSDLEKSARFYQEATGYALKRNDDGPQPTYLFAYDSSGTGTGGSIYEGKPATKGTGHTVHLAVSGTVEEAMERVRQAGGQVVSDVIDLPDGRFAYCLDLDGNSFGVFTG